MARQRGDQPVELHDLEDVLAADRSRALRRHGAAGGGDRPSALDLDDLPDDARTLFHLLITFVETAHPIDLNWATTDIEDAFPAERFGFGDVIAGPAGAPRSG